MSVAFFEALSCADEIASWKEKEEADHGIALGGDLGGVTLDEGGVDGVGERELGKVVGEVGLFVDLVRGIGRAGDEGVLGDDFGDGGLIRNDGEEAVVDDVHGVEGDVGFGDGICDGGRV